MYWVLLFFLLAALARWLLKLPAPIWRTLFVLPYLGSLQESLRPFLTQAWPFPRDGLTDFFALIVSAIGACVCVYSGTYFKSYDRKKFFPLLFAFSGSMLGVLWADNIFVFYGFWEATALTSFLLVGFKYSDPDVRKGAKQALLINMAGGLCLLLALLLLQHQTGSSSLTVILFEADKLTQHRDILLLMILLAAMIKSAQFPFHFWLPGAMVAPTPASCYLHSATMVKLGVFLLARMSPFFEQGTDWIVSLSLIGAVTLIWGMVVSLTKTDLKQLFAWTTVSSLGGMCILVGLYVPYSWRAFFAYLLAHSLYKASLFLCVGNIDKQMGGRSMDHIAGLYRRMPVTSLAMLMALGSMVGLPFSMGFLGKEYLYKSALQLGPTGMLLVLALLGASVLSIVVAYRLIQLIFKRQSDRQRLEEVGPTMWGPPLLLAAIGWLVGFFLDDMNRYFLNPVVSSIMREQVDVTLEMWSGVNLPLILSLGSLALGVFLALRHADLLTRVAWWFRTKVKPSPRIGLLGALAKKVMDRLQNGRLSSYVLWGLAAIALMLAVVVPVNFLSLEHHFVVERAWEFHLLAVLILFAGLCALLLTRRPLVQIIALGIVGFGVSLFYISFGATDLAMTQMAVETLSVLVLTLAMVFLRSNPGGFSETFQILRGVLTGLVFLGTLILCQLLDKNKNASRVSDYFVDQAWPLGRGKNVVNVILVDFRALDTLGEITVLAMTALGVHVLFLRKQRLDFILQVSPFLRTSVKVFLPVFVMVSLVLLFRGHNAPGGGFVAGLLLAVSFSFFALVHGVGWMQKRLWLRPLSWVATGLIISFCAGAVAVLEQKNFLTARWLEGSLAWLGTPLIFDVGVYLMVFGLGTSLFMSFFRREV